MRAAWRRGPARASGNCGWDEFAAAEAKGAAVQSGVVCLGRPKPSESAESKCIGDSIGRAAVSSGELPERVLDCEEPRETCLEVEPHLREPRQRSNRKPASREGKRVVFRRNGLRGARGEERYPVDGLRRKQVGRGSV